MSAEPLSWVMIMPFFKPAPGGCAYYLDTITRALAEQGDRVLIVTEQHPCTPRHEVLEGTDGKVEIMRLFPYRAGRAKKDWRSFVAYFFANLSYLRLPGIVRKRARMGFGAPRTLVHGCMFYNPNSLKFEVDSLKPEGDGLLVVDVRDMQFPDDEIALLEKFDRIVTSSLGVADDLERRSVPRAKITPIPMPFTFPPEPDQATVAATLEKHGLAGKRFLLNPNGISRDKLYGEMRDAMPLIRNQPGMEDIVLVSVGRDRDRTEADDRSEQAGLSLYLGPIPRDELLSLMKAAHFVVILSPNEAISRAALEAMAVGGRVILPDVEEFRAECGSHICADPTPEKVAQMVTDLAAEPMPRFGFERHLDPHYQPMYRALGKA